MKPSKKQVIRTSKKLSFGGLSVFPASRAILNLSDDIDCTETKRTKLSVVLFYQYA